MKTSVYLNKRRLAALEASGLPLLEVIDCGLASLAQPQPARPPKPRRASEPATSRRVNASVEQPRSEDAQPAKCDHRRAKAAKLGRCRECGAFIAS